MFIIRDRSQQDDRNAIRDPFGPNPHDMSVFANTLMKTKIPALFQSATGFRENAQRIQQELNRLAQVENRSGEEVTRAIRVSECLRKALIKARDAGVANGFQLGVSPIHFLLLNDIVKI